MSGMAGSVFLGLAGIGLGALIVDYAVSEPGESWIDEIGAKLRRHYPGRQLPVAPPPPHALPSAASHLPPSAGSRPRSDMWIGPITVTRPAPSAAPAMTKPELLARLGQAFGFAVPPAATAADISALVMRFQSMAGLPASGALDPATAMRLRQAPAHWTGWEHLVGWHHLVGAEAWESETASLGPEAQDVIRHAIAQEQNPRTLSSLASALQAAGYPQAAARVKTKTPGAQVATSGWWP